MHYFRLVFKNFYTMKQSRLLSFLLVAALLLTLSPSVVYAQRIVQELGRGVVAVKDGSQALVSWRRLAQDPEDASYRVYVRRSGGDYALLGSAPARRSCLSVNASQLPAGSEVAVTMVADGLEGPMSTPYRVESQSLRNIFMEIRFDASPLAAADYSTKYVWPCDLDGDGEMDYVVDRNPVGEGTQKVEGYLADGTFLWCIDMGPNETIGLGQDDQVTAFDIDCDGRGEVIVQTSDGTRFWDAAAGAFGPYLFGRDNADTDGDGIILYDSQGTRNPPRYITVVDGLTGAEKATVEQPYNSAYNRTNKAALMGDEYNKHVGKFGICFLDGIHPALVMEWHTRSSGGTHYYYVEAVGYDFSDGTASDWHVLWQQPTGGASFHSIRIGDPDGDGRDEMIEGAFTTDHDGSTLFNTGISHGDRFRTSDIDPERPGLETFAIQQNAPDMLGQILYDAATGESIRKWYLSAVGDVGRGDCYDLSADHLGWEMFSTMGGMYDARGTLIEGLDTYFPTEALWWDGDLGREYMASPDGNGYNADIRKYGAGRLIEMGKESGYTIKSSYGVRALFWGDIVGDWREEAILRRDDSSGVCRGIVGFSTTAATAVTDIYCLLQDPAYYGQCTIKGYYQTPNPGFYLGYDMPRPPLPPVIKTDYVWMGTPSAQYGDYSRRAAAVSHADVSQGTVLYDLAGADTVTLPAGYAPKEMFVMAPRGKHYLFADAAPLSLADGTGVASTAGAMTLWKSMAGTATFRMPLGHSGRTIVSEGTLEALGTIAGPVELRARGTLAGCATLLDTLTFEGALNYEGCRLMPGRPLAADGHARTLGLLTLRRTLAIDRRVFMELAVSTLDDDGTPHADHDAGYGRADAVHTDGDLVVTGPVVFTIVPHDGTVAPVRYELITFDGTFRGNPDHFSVRGLTGYSYDIEVGDHAVTLVVHDQREASDGVIWTGSVSGQWNYDAPNFVLDGTPTAFAPGDAVTVDDAAASTTIVLDELYPIGGLTLSNSAKALTISGDGGFSGNGNLVVDGGGKVTMNVTRSDYTGTTTLSAGTLTVKELADAGSPSSIGAGGTLTIGKATLVVSNSNASTDRGVVLADTATLQIPSGGTSLKGLVSGDGTLVKSGGGQLNISHNGANSWRGGTILKNGTLAQGTWNATFGSLGSKMDVQGNGTIVIFNNNSTSAVPNFQYAVTIADKKTLTLKLGQRCNVNGSFAGSGTLSLSFPYVRGEFRANMSKFTGKVTATGSQFRLNQATDFSQAEVVLQDEVYLAHFKQGSGTESANTTKIGALSSTGTSCSIGTGTWNVGYRGTNTTYAGTFTSAATVGKYGSGTLTLTGRSAAPITVAEGTLVAGNTADVITTAAITVKNGGTLAAQSGKDSYVSTVRVESGGTLTAGTSSMPTRPLHVKGNLTVNRDGRLVVRYRTGGTRSYIDGYDITGTVTLTSPTIVLTATADSPLADGDSLQVLTLGGRCTLSGTPTVEPATPGDGLEWDCSTLATDGCVRVKAATVVSAPDADAAPAAVYTLDGQRVADATRLPAGIYLFQTAAGVKKVIVK